MPINEKLSFIQLEQLMQTPPQFQPQHCGIVIQSRAESPPGSFMEAMIKTVSSVKYLPFKQRVNQYISEMSQMRYRNGKHKEMFEKFIKQSHCTNYAFLSAVYLLTADFYLCRAARNHIKNDCIYFEDINLCKLSIDSYIIYCAAKDLYLGTKHLTVGDLSDKTIVSSKVFAFLCNAMAIRRFGLSALESIKRENREC